MKTIKLLVTITVTDDYFIDDPYWTLENALSEYLEEEELESVEIYEPPVIGTDLDKVAEKYGKENCNTWYTDIESVLVGKPRQRECNDSLDLQEAFKAGAEWMANQGKIFDGEIVSEGLPPYKHLKATAIVDDSFKFGDKVIVQIIRKLTTEGEL